MEEQKNCSEITNTDDISLYMKEIGNNSLLTPEEEKELGRLIREGSEEEKAYAKKRLTESNLRLVVSIAKKYTGRGLPLMDLIQEGNIGLMHAVDMYDYTKDNRFSTYATWWIKQAITRSLANQSKNIKIPVHVTERIYKLMKIQKDLTQELGRDPDISELSQAAGIPESEVTDMLNASKDSVSMDVAVGEDDTTLEDFISDSSTDEPDEKIIRQMLRPELEKILNGIGEKESMILKMRYGLLDGEVHTLDEVGKLYGITRERVRQIEQRALRNLSHLKEAENLRDYL